MEDTSHLERPGTLISAIRDKATEYRCEQLRKYLANIFNDAKESLHKTE